VSVFAVDGKPLRALSVADFRAKYDSGKGESDRIRQDDRPGSQADSIKHPASNPGAQHDVHTKTDVFRAFVPKDFDDLRQIGKCRENSSDVSENVEIQSDQANVGKSFVALLRPIASSSAWLSLKLIRRVRFVPNLQAAD
jgi:hypothetical protein